MTSNLSAFNFIQERSEATPGLWNNPFSVLSANIAAVDSNVTFTFPSIETLSLFTNLDASGNLHAAGRIGLGPTPSAVTTGMLTIAVSSALSDYIHFEDTSGARSNYLLGSRVGGTADGLNLWDLSGDTMIVSFSKQSTRFFVPVVATAFDQGGQLFNIKAYGARGDGVTDDYPPIAAAISDASTFGGTVFFPSVASWYVISSPLTIPANICLLGDARTGKVNQPNPSGISRNGNFPMVVFQGTTLPGDHIQGLEVRALAIHGGGFAADMVRLVNATQVKFDRVRLVGTPGRAIYGEELFDSNFHDLLVDFCGTSNGTPGIHLVPGLGVGGEPTNVIRFSDCVFESVRGRFLSFKGNATSTVSRNHTVWLDRCKFESTIFSHQLFEAVNVYNVFVRDCTFIANNPAIASTASCLFYLENVDSAYVRGFFQTGGTAATSNAINFVQMSGVTRAKVGGWFFESSSNTLTGTSAISVSNCSQVDFSEAVWEFNPNNRAMLGGTFGGMQHVGGWHTDAPLSVATNKLFVDSSNSFVGINTNTPRSALQVITGGLSTASGALLIADQTGNLATKVGFIGTSHYTINEEPMLGIEFLSDVNNNTVKIGGGSGSFNPATIVQILTASDTTTAGGGTVRLQANSDGSVLIGNSSHTQVQVGGTFTTAVETTGLRLGTGANGAVPIEFIAGASANGYGWRVKAIDLGAENVDLTFSRRVNSVSWTTAVVMRGFTGQVQFGNGTVLAPSSAFTSDASVGFYRSGVSTIAISTGTFNLATGAVNLSMATLAAATSAVDKGLAVVFRASGLSLIYKSGSSIYDVGSGLSGTA